MTDNGASVNNTSCKFFLEKKKRHCRFPPKPGSDYCQEHACILGISIGKKRIPCPLDPSHNCFEDNLEKHLKKCNVAKLRRATEQNEFFIKGINMGPPVCSTCSDEESKVSVSNLTAAQLASMIETVKQLYQAHVEPPQVQVLEHPCVLAGLTEAESEPKADSVPGSKSDGVDSSTHLEDNLSGNPGLRKELLQQASLLGQLESVDLLTDTGWFVELGAGKGKLSHWVEKACGKNAESSFLLVDRSGVRYKMDAQNRLPDGGSKFKRIKVDIADLCLGYVRDLKRKDSVVVMGKHLCGGATDLGIRCAVDSLSKRLSGDAEQMEPPTKAQKVSEEHCDTDKSKLPKGMVIALCCHHRCDWKSYVGRPFMTSIGVTERQFDLLTRLSSWATCAKGGKTRSEKKTEIKTDLSDSNRNSSEGDKELEGDEHFVQDLMSSQNSKSLKESLSLQEREAIGRQCKRLIDTGRLHYLRSKGMGCQLREYVSDDVTPENVVLLACRDPSQLI